MYKHPGVYVEHVPSGVLAIEAASTSTAAFVGYVKRGGIVTDNPNGPGPDMVMNMGQYANRFGALGGAGGGIRDEGADPDFFGHAVAAFFANGGRNAYIVPVGRSDSPGAAGRASIANPHDPAKAFVFEARSTGSWSDRLLVELEQTLDDQGDGSESVYTLRVLVTDDAGEITREEEAFTDLSVVPDSGRFVVDVVKEQSILIKATHVDAGGAGTTLEALQSGSLADLAPSSITEPDKIKLKLSGDGDHEIEVPFTGNASTLRGLATEIEEAVRQGAAEPIRKKFIARVTKDARLLLIPGLSESATTNKVAVDEGFGTPEKLRLTGGEGASVLGYPAPLDPQTHKAIWPVSGGVDPGKPRTSDYESAFRRLRDYRDVSIVLLPGVIWNDDDENRQIIQAAVSHAESMQNRMVLVDPPAPSEARYLQTAKAVKDLKAPTSPYTALYYPWLGVANPFYDPDTAGHKPKRLEIPPSGFAAGLWARIDGARGVWKAPAGLEATVRGAVGPTLDIGNDLQGNLNSWGVNCLRSIIGPTVVWGARTLATRSKPDFRYIPVRRTQSMIGESLYRALQAVVFEPNDHRLWSSLRASATNFMDGLFRLGAFQGKKASDAYYVRCGLDSTMTQADVDAGIVRLVAAFAPLKPAEFVVVQIKQIVGQTA